MRRNTINFLVDAASALVVIGLVATGLLTRFVLPPGSGSWRLLWGMGRHDWGDVHFWLAVVGGVLLLAHMALHWQWVCVTVLRLCRVATSERDAPRRWRRNAAGVALVGLVVLLFWGFVWGARLAVRDSAPVSERGGPAWRGGETADGSELDRGGESVRGSMTLAEAAATGPMPVQTLRAGLMLPDGVSVDERLGRLSREHGFGMSRVRDVIREYQRRSSSTQRTP